MGRGNSRSTRHAVAEHRGPGRGLARALAALLLLLGGHLLFVPARAQAGRSPEASLALGDAHVKVRAHKLAAEAYAEAARAFEREARTFKTDGAIRSRLQAAAGAFGKARAQFEQAGATASAQAAAREETRVLKLLGKASAVPEKPKARVPDPVPGAQVPYAPGKEIVLQARKTSFSLVPPAALPVLRPVAHTRATNQMLKDSEALVSVITQVPEGRLAFTLKEYLGDRSPKPIADACDDHAALYSQSGAATVLGRKEVQLVPLRGGPQACRTTGESRQLDTRKTVFSFEYLFYFRECGYHLVGSAPIEWKTAVLAMLGTFAVTGAAPAPLESGCAPGATLPVPGLAFEDTWMLPDPAGTLRITLSPNLPRREVPAAWHDLIAATRKAVGQIEHLDTKLEPKEDPAKEIEVLEAVVEDLEIPQITPGQLADAYLAVLDKVIAGIGSLEGRISNMAVDLTVELPYLEVRTACIPRFRCVKGQWEPDHGTMDFERRGEARRVDRKVFRHLSPGLLRQKEAELQVLPRRLGEQARKVSEGECGQHRHKLHGLAWPPKPDTCARLDLELQKAKAAVGRLEAERKDLQQARAAEAREAPGRLEVARKDLARAETELKAAREELARAREAKRNLELNKKQMEPGRFEAQFAEAEAKVQARNARLDQVKEEHAQAKARLSSLESGRVRADLERRLRALDGDLVQAQAEAARLASELKACREKEQALRRP